MRKYKRRCQPSPSSTSSSFIAPNRSAAAAYAPNAANENKRTHAFACKRVVSFARECARLWPSRAAQAQTSTRVLESQLKRERPTRDRRGRELPRLPRGGMVVTNVPVKCYILCVCACLLSRKPGARFFPLRQSEYIYSSIYTCAYIHIKPGVRFFLALALFARTKHERARYTQEPEVVGCMLCLFGTEFSCCTLRGFSDCSVASRRLCGHERVGERTSE